MCVGTGKNGFIVGIASYLASARQSGLISIELGASRVIEPDSECAAQRFGLSLHPCSHSSPSFICQCSDQARHALYPYPESQHAVTDSSGLYLF